MIPDPAPIIELIEAFRRSKVMFAGVSLGIFDRLEVAPASASVLARELALSEEPLKRLLEACAGLGFLQKLDDRYSNTPLASAYLTRGSENTLAGYVLYSNDVLFPLWSHLDDAVREGGNRWTQTFGTKAGIFDHFFRTEDALRTFLKGMHGFGVLSSPAVVAAFDLSRYRRMVDLGGGTGHLAIAACQRYPELRAVVFDLPRVIEESRRARENRVEWRAGDFFKDALPEGDLYCLGQILHDWDNDTCTSLLERIYERLPPGGAILLYERLLADDKSGPVSALLQSLNMLLCTEGKERTLAEYRELLEAAGFEHVRGYVTGAPFDAVMATKADADAA